MSIVTVNRLTGELPNARACWSTMTCLPTRFSGDFVDHVNFLRPGAPGRCASPGMFDSFGAPIVLSTDLTLHT